MRGEGVQHCVRLLAAMAACWALAGCSLQVGGLSDERVETTGSIGKPNATALSPDLAQEDWRRAKGALATALDPQGSGAGVKWENPDSGASGTFTPVAQPFVRSDEVCRSFLATLSFPNRTSTLQGTACRPAPNEWHVIDVRPWTKPS